MFDKRKYPQNWPQIRARILQRAGNRCEGCVHYPHCRAENGKPHPETGSKVVLGIAHWPDISKSNVDPRNLRATCQRCHLSLDRAYHTAVQRENRRKRREARQPALMTPEGERLDA